MFLSAAGAYAHIDLGKRSYLILYAYRIVVYSPQIIEVPSTAVYPILLVLIYALQNYQLKSGEGLSVIFVLVWLLGDFCNLIGAILAG